MIEISSERVGLITADPKRHFGGKYDGLTDPQCFTRLCMDYDSDEAFSLYNLDFKTVGLLKITTASFMTTEDDHSDSYLTVITLFHGPIEDFIAYVNDDQPEDPEANCPDCEANAENYMGGPNYGCDEFDPGPKPCPRHTPDDMGPYSKGRPRN